ncbi:ATP-binding protein [Lysobacter sp. D1-1-M9]|uniref:ATP-binding protein n=1 Tax=Novilysobacter longmucuonensis TaxID=3098603 RepID=UPI002FCA7607
MSPTTGRNDHAADEAARELAGLQHEIVKARAQLAGLQRHVREAQAQRDHDQVPATTARRHSDTTEANTQLADDHALAMATHERRHSANREANTQRADDHAGAIAAHERQHSENKEANTQRADNHAGALAAHERQHSEDKAAHTQLVGDHERAEAAHENQHTQQQEANAQLVLAALGAQDLQAAAEQAQRRQTEFLAVLAHELRNPLAPISSAASMLGMVGSDDDTLPRLREIIERQVTHMSRLVGDLLDVSRASTGKLRLERETVDLARIIDQAIDASRPAIKARGQHLDLHRPARALEVHGDPVRLAQVLCNLLDNACKYTPKGGELGLSVAVEGESVVITVSDNGIGISADALGNVFEPFVQEPHATGFHGGGLGIGLTVVKQLIDAHGGTVTARSAGSGQGSQFVVTLPMLDPEHL